MKLCPQCEFIYEDDQSFCDMDGKELVFKSSPSVFEETIVPGSPELVEYAAVAAGVSPVVAVTQQTGWQARRSAVAALAAILLVVLLFAVFYARTHQTRSGNSTQASSQTSSQVSNESTQPASALAEQSPDLASEPSASLNSAVEPSAPDSPDAQTAAATSVVVSSTSFSRERLAANPVSPGGSAPNGRGSVIVWLTNGASIKADEAWERKEGVWYRQAGMVTFLKRSRVRSIQRLGTSDARVKSTNLAENRRTPENLTAQNRPRVGRPAAEGAQKQSRVTSLLKTTARFLKKPFKS